MAQWPWWHHDVMMTPDPGRSWPDPGESATKARPERPERPGRSLWTWPQWPTGSERSPRSPWAERAERPGQRCLGKTGSPTRIGDITNKDGMMVMCSTCMTAKVIDNSYNCWVSGWYSPKIWWVKHQTSLVFGSIKHGDSDYTTVGLGMFSHQAGWGNRDHVGPPWYPGYVKHGESWQSIYTSFNKTL